MTRFKDPELAREAGRKGAAAKWERYNAKKQKAELKPFAGTILDLMDLAGLIGESWESWRSFWRTVYALPMNDADIGRLVTHTGRSAQPAEQAREAWMVIGRRGGKSRMAALGGLFAGIRRDYSSFLAPGELGVVPVIAPDRVQARGTLGYLKGLVRIPEIKPYVTRVLRDSVELKTGAEVRVSTASFRTVRGATLVGVVAEEVAFWLSDETSSNPDSEILTALRPGMATVKGALLLGLSSPYAAKGELYKAYNRYFGSDDPAGVCWNADTLSMNPDIDPRVISDAFADDPVAAASEYGTGGSVQFRRDVEAFLDAEAIANVTMAGRKELPPVDGTRYVGFVDPSGGSMDAFTIAIAHSDKNSFILDAVRERRPPFSPEEVVKEFAELLRSYRIGEVTGDRYAGEWPRERFQVHGIRYIPSERVKSAIYGELLPLINGARVELLDIQRLSAQLTGLERRVARGGKDSIDHAPGGHDDIANAAAGALVLASIRAKRGDVFFPEFGPVSEAARVATAAY